MSERISYEEMEQLTQGLTAQLQAKNTEIAKLVKDNNRLRVSNGIKDDQIAALERQITTMEGMVSDADNTVISLVVETVREDLAHAMNGTLALYQDALPREN